MDLPAKPPADVRMRGFSHRATVEQALSWVDSAAHPLGHEAISIWHAAGRVLATTVVSLLDIPAFARSMMDGYAIRANETQGASPYNRLEFTIVGQSLPGQPFDGVAGAGQAVRIMTGAPLPDGCDAVLPAERVEATATQLFALDEVSPGKNVGRPGEDVAHGMTVLSAGRVLRPQDIAILSSLGKSTVEVIRQPRVRIVVTGNELLPAASAPSAFKIPDSNGPLLAALVARDGGIPVLTPPHSQTHCSLPTDYLVPDDCESILTAMQSEADITLVSGGSSVGQEDYAPSLLAEHGELAIHGIAMRPSSPTGMGRMNDRLVFMLPGNPVSCLCGYDFFAGRAIRLLGGRSKAWPYRTVRLPLSRKLVSQVGRVDYARVRILASAGREPQEEVEPIAISGASILSSTTTADGFVIIPADSEGHAADAMVDVFLYDK